MNKLFSAFCLMIVSSAFAFAQTTGSDYRKSEFFVGYSNQQVDTGADLDEEFGVDINDRTTFNGFNVSGVYNVSRYVGVKGDFSGAYRSQDFSFATGAGTTANTVTLDTRNSVYNVLGGVQVKDNASDTRVKPFAHALVGVGHVRSKVSDVRCSNPAVASTICSGFNGETASDTGFAGAFGGGLDIKVNDRIDIRAIQADYNPIRINGQTGHNFRFGVGVVFK